MSDDSAAINSEIAQAYAAGGGRIDLGQGVLQCDDPILLAPLNQKGGVRLVGASIDGTTLHFTDPTRAAVMMGGITDGAAPGLFEHNRYACWPGLEHLTIDGGAYGLVVNNALSGYFLRVRVRHQIQNLRGLGQNEGHHFASCYFEDARANAVAIGYRNEGDYAPPSGYNFPDAQKNIFDGCYFTRCRDLDEHGEPLSGRNPDGSEKPSGGAVYVFSEDPAIVSGYNEFRKPTFIANAGHSMHLVNADATSVYDMTTEEYPHEDRERGMIGLWIEGPSSSVNLYGGKLIAGAGREFGYGIQADTGILNLFGVTVSGSTGADVYAGGAASIHGGLFGSVKPIWVSPAAAPKSRVFGAMNGSGEPLGAPHVA